MMMTITVMVTYIMVVAPAESIVVHVDKTRTKVEEESLIASTVSVVPSRPNARANVPDQYLDILLVSHQGSALPGLPASGDVV